MANNAIHIHSPFLPSAFLRQSGSVSVAIHLSPQMTLHLACRNRALASPTKLSDCRKVSSYSAHEVLHKILAFRWRILLKEQAAQFMDDKISRVKSWLQDFCKNIEEMEIE